MNKAMNNEALQANLRMIGKRSELLLEQARINGELTPEAARLSELAADEAFCGKLLMAESAEDAQRIFRESGLELTIEQVNAFGEHIISVTRKLSECEDELSDEDLELIAGGASASQTFDSVANSVGEALDIAGQIFENTSVKNTLGELKYMIKSAASKAVNHVFAPIIQVKRFGGWIKSWF